MFSFNRLTSQNYNFIAITKKESDTSLSQWKLPLTHQLLIQRKGVIQKLCWQEEVVEIGQNDVNVIFWWPLDEMIKTIFSYHLHCFFAFPELQKHAGTNSVIKHFHYHFCSILANQKIYLEVEEIGYMGKGEGKGDFLKMKKAK